MLHSSLQHHFLNRCREQIWTQINHTTLVPAYSFSVTGAHGQWTNQTLFNHVLPCDMACSSGIGFSNNHLLLLVLSPLELFQASSLSPLKSFQASPLPLPTAYPPATLAWLPQGDCESKREKWLWTSTYFHGTTHPWLVSQMAKRDTTESFNSSST